ncbi:DUF1329 domain-containing protein [Herminiimonas arsenitoxidans]|uniref:DUF1329 domain-containing protein n=1 Tax=Herminiimonas arsenitoxidans TaxID=1809410 RepID=UPI000970E7D7|nr:DUF1329 domain-containing protein [Herminiimonas arsenitoxidans]
MNYRNYFIAIATGTLITASALAAPTPEEAKELGVSLTPMGAEKAGNKDGTIPAWDGGICKPIAGYKPIKGASGGAPYPDPFPNEKPLFRITAANLSKYADKIDAGTKELFQRYPNYAMDVYPTHRTACFPNYVYENTIKRVMSPKLVGTAPGLIGAHAQVPFPIPKSGFEAMWNANLKFEHANTKGDIDAVIVDTGGRVIKTSYQIVENQNAYWDNTITSIPEDKPYWSLIARSTYPPSEAGGGQMRHQFLRTDQKDPVAWSYIPGQRRVRLAPEFSYDTVATTSGGILLFDEINGFDGKMDKYDFKLIGKKEMYVPYNTYKFSSAPIEEQSTKDFGNVDLLRWELHRVWVVEGTLKQGQRHVQQKKIFALDEDSWSIMTYYGLDSAGKVHHAMQLLPTQQYDKPELRTGHYLLYDLNRGIYGNQNKQMGGTNPGFYQVAPYPANYFTPDSLAGRGIR